MEYDMKLGRFILDVLSRVYLGFTIHDKEWTISYRKRVESAAAWIETFDDADLAKEQFINDLIETTKPKQHEATNIKL